MPPELASQVAALPHRKMSLLLFRGYALALGRSPDSNGSCRKGTALPHIGRIAASRISQSLYR
jgi:hypothetical protein